MVIVVGLLSACNMAGQEWKPSVLIREAAYFGRPVLGGPTIDSVIPMYHVRNTDGELDSGLYTFSDLRPTMDRRYSFRGLDTILSVITMAMGITTSSRGKMEP